MSKFIDKIENKAGEQYELKHSYTNESGNIELTSAGTGKKLNLVSDSDIQIKTGDDSVIQLDKENDATNPDEVEIKMCNGSYTKTKRVVGTKINTAEIIIDNQNCNTDKYSTGEIHIKARHDKKYNPVYVKAHARAWDIRCEGNGGIALQPAGEDGEDKENKIKFESDRTSSIDVPGKYKGEGGKGLEFGTFNNLHTSLYTGDYRFNELGVIYPSTRGKIFTNEVTGKTDYPTQKDDFKDIPICYKLIGEGNSSKIEIKKCTHGDDTEDTEGKWEPQRGFTMPNVTFRDLILAVELIKKGTPIDTIVTALSNISEEEDVAPASEGANEADNNEQ